MATSGNGLGLLIGAGAFVYGATKKTEAESAARALDAVRADAMERIGQLRKALQARDIALEGVRAQLRTATTDYAQTKKQLDATSAARMADQQAHAQERANLNSQIRALTLAANAERERARRESTGLEARISEGVEREREKDQRIAALEARVQELEDESR